MLSPGVEITEKDLTQRVPASSTVVAGLPICSTKGPNNVATLITNEDDYISIFGKPTNDATVYNSYFTAAAYLVWGNTLYCARVEGDDARASTLTMGTSGSSLAISYENEITADDYPLVYADMDDTSIDEILYVVAIGTGTFYDDYSVAIVTADDYAALTDLKTALSKARNTSHKKAIAEQYYTGTTSVSGVLVGDLYFRIGTAGADTAPDGGAWAGTISPTGDLSASALADDVVSESGGIYTPDSTQLGYYLSLEYGPTGTKDFGFYVFDEDGDLVESYLASTDPDAIDYRKKKIFAPDLINPVSKYVQVFVKGDTSATVEPISMGKTNLAGGADDRSTEPTGNLLTELNALFGKRDDLQIDLLVDPNFSDIVKQEIDQICQTRMDCFGILSMPKDYCDAGVEDMADYVNDTLNITSSYSAIYGNYFKIYDRHNDTYRWVPVAGYIAGAYAFNDKNTDAWWAPAGFSRGQISGVVDLAINPDEPERDVLYQARINPIVDFPGQGLVIFGQKTLQSTASAFDRVNVRRLFITIERVIRPMARNFLWELNDEFSRARVVSILDPYFAEVKSRRGVYDYRIVCDETNNTATTIDANKLIIDIYLKPTRAIEFIHVTAIAVPTGVSFEEVVGA